MPRGFTSTKNIGHRCNIPSYTITVDFLGNCLLCDCDGWLPIPVGKVWDFESIDAVFCSPAARTIQEDVEKGNFSWCAIDHCGIRNQDRIKTVVTLAINIDESCNLHCPSCRRDPIMLSQGPEFEKKLHAIERIMQWLDRHPDPVHVVISGNGDPLASHIMRPLLLDLEPNSAHTFKIMTNGLLIKKLLPKMKILDQVREISISVDAGTESVYEDVRRPAKWQHLLDNLDFLQQIGKNTVSNMSFILQNKNFRDIPEFVALCRRFGLRGHFTPLNDWGTWSITRPETPDSWTIQNGLFSDHDVLDRGHPNHAEALDLVQQHLTEPDISFSPAILKTIKKATAYDQI